MASAPEPSTAFWAVGIAASLAVHAGLVSGAALLAGRYAEASAPTEITFSDEASPTAQAVPAAAAPATASELASPVAAERVEPSTATPAEKAETLEPAQAIAATEPEPAATSSNAEPAAVAQNVEAAVAAEIAGRAETAPAPEAAPAVSGETAQTVTAQERPVPAAQAESAPDAASAAGAAAESAPAIAAQDVAPAGNDRTEQLVALQSPETIVAAPTGSQVATAPEAAQPPASTGAAAVASASAAETVQSREPAAGSGAVAAVTSGGIESAAPAGSSPEVVTGVASEAVQPSGGEPDASGTAVVPGSQQPAETLRPLETALLVPARPNSVLGTEVDKPTDRYRRIVDFIRGYPGGDCFIALPAMDLQGTVTFQTFGRDKAREDRFREALSAIDGLKTEISSGDVADPQCLALAFAQAARRYPGFSLVIDLDETEMASGDRLSGKVLNSTGRDVHLLLVDDEGIVQSMDSFLSAKEGVDRSFSVPLTLTRGPVATKQILMAIATDPPIWGLDKVKEPAAGFFRELAAQVEASNADVDLAVEGFDVR